MDELKNLNPNQELIVTIGQLSEVFTAIGLIYNSLDDVFEKIPEEKQREILASLITTTQVTAKMLPTKARREVEQQIKLILSQS